MQVIDRWTTQDGSWDIDAQKKYSIDAAHRDKYLQGRDIPGAGADHHIMVNAAQGNTVEFLNADGTTGARMTIKEWGDWVNFPMSRDASYSPDRGEIGPWQVLVNNETIAFGIGLPYGWHVSTFLVMGEGTKTGTGTGTEPAAKQITVIVDGVSYTNFKVEH